MEEGGNLRKGILERMRLPGYRPLNKGELARELALKADQRTDLRAELAALEREGLVVRGKKARYRLREIFFPGSSGFSPGAQRGFIQTRKIQLT